MTNSWKLGLCAALCVATTIVGCGDDDDSTNSNGGSGNQAGSAGSSAGKAGNGNGGSSAGNNNGGNAGKGGNAGSANGGSAGGGGKAGSGGTAPAMGGEGGEGGAEGGMGGAGPMDCMEESVGGASDGAGGAASAETAVVLVDNVTVKNGNTVVKTWAFADGSDILDVVKGDIGDKWLRPPFDTGADNLAYSSPFAHDVFAKCDGKPAGSLMNIVPFTKAAQYYKLSIGFAQADWSGYVVSADVKLVSGGNREGACDVNAKLFVQDGAGDKAGTAVQLNVGDGWKSMTLTVPASTMVDHLSVSISDYTCL